MYDETTNDATSIGDVANSQKMVMAPCRKCGKVDVPAYQFGGGRYIAPRSGPDDERSVEERTEIRPGRVIKGTCATCEQADVKAQADKARQDFLDRETWLRTPEGQRRIGVPPQYFDCVLTECPPKVAAALGALYRGDASDKVRSVVLQGCMGSGKTRATYSLVRRAHLDQRQAEVRRTVCGELMLRLRGSGFKDEAYEQLINREQYYRGLLILDDVRVDGLTQVMREGLFRIIDSRLEEGRRLLLTTNSTIQEWRDVMPRAVSRLTAQGRGRWLVLPAVDYRQMDGTLL